MELVISGILFMLLGLVIIVCIIIEVRSYATVVLDMFQLCILVAGIAVLAWGIYIFPVSLIIVSV